MSELYPISEIFTSVQGEGIWSGQLQTFIRLAGCTVGKPYPKNHVIGNYLDGLRQLPIYTEQCTLYSGSHFPCDTDYRVKERLTSFQLMEEIPKNVSHVCITGGEPLMHNLDTLFSYLWGEGKTIHIETSGTIDKYLKSDIWVTVSPKFNVYLNMLKRADEIKILVDKDFSPTKPIEALHDGMVQVISILELAEKKPLFLQPVNAENTVDADNLQRCLDIQQEYGSIFRLSPQGHKLMSQYTRELVR